MTKKEARAHKIAWNLALAEGRVIRYDNGRGFKSYPTVEAAQKGLKDMRVVWLDAEIVTVS